MYFGVPATKPGIAKALFEADVIGRKDVADFIDPLLVKKICLSRPYKILQANKVFKACKVKQEGIVQFTKRKQPEESLKERLWLV